jgi:hypothetical protein
MNYNLDEQVAESFEFTLGGQVYSMKYPTTEEVEEARKLKEGSDEQEAWLYSFITPKDPTALPIREAMAKMNVKILGRFKKMIQAEFADEQ